MTMIKRPEFIAAPLLVLTYGVFRIIDGLDGERGPGPPGPPGPRDRAGPCVRMFHVLLRLGLPALVAVVQLWPFLARDDSYRWWGYAVVITTAGRDSPRAGLPQPPCLPEAG